MQTVVDPNSEAPARRAVLLVNTKSRRGQEWFDQAKERLREQEIELISARSFRKIEELKRATQDAIAQEIPIVIVGGGDGTFSAIARYFVERDTVLGVLPLGTGNAFARDLGITADVRTACDTIVKGKVASVDLGIAGDDYFLNVATLGLTTRIAQALTVEMKRKWGRFVYFFALMEAIQKVKPFVVTIESEHGKEEFETLQLVLGNGRFHAGPFPLSPDATITDGKLTLYALEGTSRAAFVRLAMGLPTGHHVDLPDVRCLNTVAGTIRSVPSMPITIDGETSSRTPLVYGVAPKSLKVLVPETFAG